MPVLTAWNSCFQPCRSRQPCPRGRGMSDGDCGLWEPGAVPQGRWVWQVRKEAARSHCGSRDQRQQHVLPSWFSSCCPKVGRQKAILSL